MTPGVRAEVFRRYLSLVTKVLVGACLSAILMRPAEAQTVINVSTGSDLVNALTTVDNNPGTSYQINITQNITLTASTILPAISSNAIINGGNNTLDGGG